MGLEVVIRLIVEGHGQGHNACTYILSDCQKAIDVFTVHSEFEKYSEIWERVFSERELTFTFAICYRPSVCRLSVVCL